MKKYSISIVCIGALLLLYGTAHATIWYVHPDSALNTIQAGLDSCSTGDTVRVGAGIYVENIIWPNTQGIHLISEFGPDTTVIDGNSAGSVITCTTGIDTTTIIRGFTIQNGLANSGGGIACYSNSSPAIDSCTISSNDGDGVYCEDSANPVINYNDIINNTDYGVYNADPSIWVDAEYNWWGDPSGPGGAGTGTGDPVSQWVDYIPWLFQTVGVEERPIVKPVDKQETLTATIFSGPLQLPKDKKCKVYDITGRVVEPNKIQPGMYFIEIDGVVTQKVVKVR